MNWSRGHRARLGVWWRLATACVSHKRVVVQTERSARNQEVPRSNPAMPPSLVKALDTTFLTSLRGRDRGDSTCHRARTHTCTVVRCGDKSQNLPTRSFEQPGESPAGFGSGTDTLTFGASKCQRTKERGGLGSEATSRCRPKGASATEIAGHVGHLGPGRIRANKVMVI
ncbi:hypothetical protein Bbelb_266290 [Branchiostoma belcheri]|nr:hypothetical protein Bbelb_266290 [Branchiostoma belcheri]